LIIFWGTFVPRQRRICCSKSDRILVNLCLAHRMLYYYMLFKIGCFDAKQSTETHDREFAVKSGNGIYAWDHCRHFKISSISGRCWKRLGGQSSVYRCDSHDECHRKGSRKRSGTVAIDCFLGCISLEVWAILHCKLHICGEMSDVMPEQILWSYYCCTIWAPILSGPKPGLFFTSLSLPSFAESSPQCAWVSGDLDFSWGMVLFVEIRDLFWAHLCL